MSAEYKGVIINKGKIINKLAFCVTILLCSFATVNAQPVSYSEAMAQMFAQHGDLLAAESNVKKYEYDRRAAFGLHLPQVTLDAKYTHMNDELALQSTVELPPMLPLPPIDINYRLQEQDFFKANANLVWPIFTGGKIYAANSAADSAYKGAESDREIVRANLAQELTEKYFSLQLAAEASLLYQEVQETLRHHYENTVSKEKAGVAAKVERMHAQVSLNSAERDYNQSLQDVEISRVALKNLLTLDSNPVPTTPLFVLDPKNIATLEDFLNKTSVNSPQIKKISAMQDLAMAGIHDKRSTLLPTFYLYGSYELYREQLTMMDPEWYVGAGVQWNVFEGMGGVNKYLAAKKTEQSVAHKSAQVKKDINTLAEVYYMRMLKAYEKYQSAKGSLEFATEYLRVRERAFANGFATSVDVVDAQTSLSKNRLDILSAAYEFDIALFKLLALSGDYFKFEEYRNNPNAEVLK